MSFPQIHSSPTKAGIISQIESTQKALLDFYRSFPDDKLNSPGVPEGWSAARNMKHVVSTYGYFGVWIGLPKWLLRLFGKPGLVKPVEEQSPTNRPGITDYGTYPGKHPATPGQKEKLLARIEESGNKFRAKVESRSEEELDSFKGPFGGMNLRVFALFILKHNLHHTNVAKLRIEATE